MLGIDPLYGLQPLETYRDTRILSPAPGAYGLSFGGGNTLLFPSLAKARAAVDAAAVRGFGSFNSDREISEAVRSGFFGEGWGLVAGNREGSVYAAPGTPVQMAGVIRESYEGQLGGQVIKTGDGRDPSFNVPTPVLVGLGIAALGGLLLWRNR